MNTKLENPRSKKKHATGKPKGPNTHLENQRVKAGKPKVQKHAAGKPKGPNTQLENQRV